MKSSINWLEKRQGQKSRECVCVILGCHRFSEGKFYPFTRDKRRFLELSFPFEIFPKSIHQFFA